MAIIPLAASLLPAAYQIGQGFYQKNQAKKLKESTFVPPELLMNRDLAAQQGYSRRAPGQAFAEEGVRRNTATVISAANRNFGGDVNKSAAVAAAAGAQANDDLRRIAADGARFSERAFDRVADANVRIAGEKRRNRDEFNTAKAALIEAGNQNMFSGLSNVASAGLTHYLSGGFQGKSRASAGGGSPAQAVGGQIGAMFNRGTGMNPWADYLYTKNGYFQDPTGVWRMPGFTTNRVANARFGGGNK